MAREYAPVRLSIWSDDDFRALSPGAQHLYFVLMTAPSLTHCGVADWRPARLAALAGGWTVDAVSDAADELSATRYIVVDAETEEVLVRSFIRHDGLMKQPNMAVAMCTAHTAVASRVLRGVVVHELRRLSVDQPDLAAWGAKASKALLDDMLVKDAIDPSDIPPGNPSTKGSGNPSTKGSGRASRKGQSNPSVNPSPTPRPTPEPDSCTDSVPTERAPQQRRSDEQAADPSPEATIANTVYDHAQGMVAWVTVQQIAKKALRVKGATVESVAKVMCGLYDANKPIILTTVGQALQASSQSRTPTPGWDFMQRPGGAA